MTKQSDLFPDAAQSFSPVWLRSLRKAWRNMIARCYDPDAERFDRYGGRGIVVCDDWRASPFAFVLWAVEAGYRPGLQLDRENNDGPYCPNNCRFVNRKVNSRNRCDNLRLPDGRALLDVAEQNGLPDYLARNRVYSGWSPEQACGLVPPPCSRRGPAPRMFLSDGTPLSDAIRASGLSVPTVRARIAKGWSTDDAVSIPPRVKRVFLSKKGGS